MSTSKGLTIKERTILDSLHAALREKPANKIRLALQLSNLCQKLFKAASGKKK